MTLPALIFLNHMLLPFLLFILSFILRLALISKGAYHVDTVFLILRAQETLETFQIQYLLGFGRPLTVILSAISIVILKLFSIDDPVFAVNFISVFFGAASVPILYLIVKKMLDATTALFAALLFSVFPLFWALSSYGNSQVPNIFFILLSLLLMLRYRDSREISQLIGSAAALGCAAATRTQELGMVFFPVMYLLFTAPGRKSIFRNLIFFWGTTALVALAFHLPLILNASENNYFSNVSIFLSDGMANNFKGIFSDGIISAFQITLHNFSIAGMTCALLGLILLAINNMRAFILILLWLIVPLLFYGNIKTLAPRYFMICYIPLIISVGYAYAYCWRSFLKYRLVILAVFFLTLFISAERIYPILAERHKTDVWKNFAEWVSSQTPPDSVTIAADDGPFIQFYAQREFIYQLTSLRYPLTGPQLEEFKDTIDSYLRDGRKVFSTSTGLWSNNPDDVFYEFLKKNYRIEYLGKKEIDDFHLGETYKAPLNNSLFELTGQPD